MNEFAATLDTPATAAFPVTPGTDLPMVTRAVYAGTAGDVTGLLVDDSEPVTFSNVPAGTILPVRFRHVSAAPAGLLGLV